MRGIQCVQIVVFRTVISYNVVNKYEHFGGACWLHPQDWSGYRENAARACRQVKGICRYSERRWTEKRKNMRMKISRSSQRWCLSTILQNFVMQKTTVWTISTVKIWKLIKIQCIFNANLYCEDWIFIPVISFTIILETFHVYYISFASLMLFGVYMKGYRCINCANILFPYIINQWPNLYETWHEAHDIKDHSHIQNFPPTFIFICKLLEKVTFEHILFKFGA